MTNSTLDIIIITLYRIYGNMYLIYIELKLIPCKLTGP